MHPAFAQERLTAARQVKRLSICMFPHGATDRWLPTGVGPTFELGPGLVPLERHKHRMLVVGGLSSAVDRNLADFHDRAVASWLTGCEMKKGRVEVGVSMDQIAAAHLGAQVRFGSLEMSTEQPNAANGTPFYRDAQTMLPVEENPRTIFERMFGDTSNLSPEGEKLRLSRDRSTLDLVTSQLNALKARIGRADKVKLDQYLESIRDVERRLQMSLDNAARDLPKVARPPGIPDKWSDHVKAMFDLQALAFQADMTRVNNFMFNGESSLLTFPEIGVSMQHHEASHHNYEQEKLDALHKINVLQSELFAYYLDRLSTIEEPSGSVLDTTIVLYGSTLSNPTVHSQRDLPIVIVSGQAAGLGGARTLRFPGDTTPLANLHLTLLDRLDVPTDKLGNSTAELRLDRLAL